MRLPLLLLLLWNSLVLAEVSAIIDPDLNRALERYSPAAEAVLERRFHHAGVDYPPQRIQLITLKDRRIVELWVFSDTQWKHIHDYPVLAASGVSGPKLREGDRQVPEGFYRIEALNPNSAFHLSMKLDYPNTFDWANASVEGRMQPGSNIFIHGSTWSAGCLAMGNRVIEELFVLVARIGVEQAGVLIAPWDFRLHSAAVKQDSVPWVGELYRYLAARLQQFPLAAKVVPCNSECDRLAAAH